MTTLPPVRFINRDVDTARRAATEAALARAGLPALRLPAITPGTMPEHLARRFAPGGEAVLGRGERACFASHLAAAEAIAQAPPGWHGVAEDDVVFLAGAEEIAAVLAAAGELSGFHALKMQRLPKSPTILRARTGSHALVEYFHAPLRTELYFLTPEGARRLLDLAWEIAEPFDVFLRRVARGDLRLLGVVPPLTKQARGVGSVVAAEGGRRQAGWRAKRRREVGAGIRRELRFAAALGPALYLRLAALHARMNLGGPAPDDVGRYRIAPWP
ncbi:MAG: glycosyltransferase family 25 protein [Pseudomonadota bacterium]